MQKHSGCAQFAQDCPDSALAAFRTLNHYRSRIRHVTRLSSHPLCTVHVI